jgi:hypothetical protein
VIELKASGSPSEGRIGSAEGETVAWEYGEDDEEVSIVSAVLVVENH